MTSLRLAFVAVLAGCTVAAAARANDWKEESARRSLNAVAISRLAAKYCDGLAVDRGLEKLILSSHDMQQYGRPETVPLDRFTSVFEKRREAACRFAYYAYGKTSASGINVGMRLLYVTSPF